MVLLETATIRIVENPLHCSEIEKPCKTTDYCPYGVMVEQFPLRSGKDGRSCKAFGHDCPVYYLAGDLTEDKWVEMIKQAQLMD